MSFRVMHYLGNREDLLARARSAAPEMRDLEDREDFDEDEWDQAVDDLASGELRDSSAAQFLLHEMICSYEPVSTDFGIGAYHALSVATGGRLAHYLTMFQEGHDFITGAAGFGEESSCGYLEPAEVTEVRDLLHACGPHAEAAGLGPFVASLAGTFDRLAAAGRGSLFLMG